ncbi:MAG TPA: hypothetical protein VE860_27730 [Chthoniobacterales bacterium]|nr:hypothetical protein [Chthoniobacterales bacterium]
MISPNTPKPQSAIVLALFIIAVFCAEMFWLCNRRISNEALYVNNVRQANQNYLDERKLTQLKAAAVRINSLYLRLQDPIVPARDGQQLPSIEGPNARQNGPEPVAIQDFVKAGFVAVPGIKRRHEASAVFELASDRLEFHRIIPLFAQEENSNAFLFIDHLELKRPATTEAFSVHPTALESRLKVRMFTSATQ